MSKTYDADTIAGFNTDFRDELTFSQVRGKGNFSDQVLWNLLLSSNQGQDFVATHEADSAQSFGQDFRAWRESKNISFARKWHLVWDSMPRFYRGPAEILSFYVWLPNFVFSYVANFAGFILKSIGDMFAYGARKVFLFPFSFNASPKKSSAAQPLLLQPAASAPAPALDTSAAKKRHWSVRAIIFIGLALLAIPTTAIAIPLWLIAQPFHFLANTIRCAQHFLDGIANLVISITALLITKPFLKDKATYTHPMYSIHAIAKNGLYLAVIGMLIAISLIPFAGPVSAFLGGVVFNMSIFTLGGAINIGICTGILSAIHLGSIPVNMTDMSILGWFRRRFPALTPSLPAMDVHHVPGATTPASGDAASVSLTSTATSHTVLAAADSADSKQSGSGHVPPLPVARAGGSSVAGLVETVARDGVGGTGSSRSQTPPRSREFTDEQLDAIAHFGSP